MIPLVVIEGADGSIRAARAALERRGWQVIDGWRADVRSDAGRWSDRGAGRVVRSGVVTSQVDAANAVLTALGGAGLLVAARAERDVIDRLCEDLRRLGPVDHRIGDQDGTATGLTDEQRAVLMLMLHGDTLGQAASRLHLSRRTVDRRLADIRRVYRVLSTAEALSAARRQGDL